MMMTKVRFIWVVMMMTMHSTHMFENDGPSLVSCEGAGTPD